MALRTMPDPFDRRWAMIENKIVKYEDMEEEFCDDNGPW